MIRKIYLDSQEHTQIIDITSQVRSLIEASQIKDGICTIYIPHTSAAICIQENADPLVHTDILNALERLVPSDFPYLHQTERKNAYAHIKSALIGASQTVIIEQGKVLLGTYQSIYFFEFDGPRQQRQVWLKIQSC
jgi:secondary thiamine-phosphate synthase enzyme